MRSKIIGLGHYVPERVVKNEDLEKMMDTTDKWIQERTGIQERRWFTPGEDTTANMGVKASRIAMERAGIEPGDIDLVIFATLSPDYFFPGPGVCVQEELGLRTVAALDVRAQCSGFIYGLSVADQYIKTGMYKTILVIGSEVQSNWLDLTTRGRAVSVLFGDGAGAAIVQATENENQGILSTHLHSEGANKHLLMIKGPGTAHAQRIYNGIEDDHENIFMQMEGNKVFKNAVTRFEEVVMESLDANNMTINDLDLFVPHQANLRITQYVQNKLNLPDEKVYSNVQRFGNTSGATIPIALSELWEQGKLNEGMLISLAAFGSGFTWASALIRW